MRYLRFRRSSWRRFRRWQALRWQLALGRSEQRNLSLTARSITAKEALEMGLVNGVADDPETLVTETLSRVKQLSPAALVDCEEGVLCVGRDSLR